MAKGKGSKIIERNEHLNQAGAKKVIRVDEMPGRVIQPAVNISSAGVFVGKGNLIKLMISNDPTYVAFSDDPSIAAVTVNTTPAIRLNTTNAVYRIVATGNYIRASHVQIRLEVIEESDAFEVFEV